MTDAPKDAEARARAARRRRLAEVFGDVLPEQTGDDTETDESGADRRTRDEWLRGEVPPHHG